MTYDQLIRILSDQEHDFQKVSLPRVSLRIGSAQARIIGLGGLQPSSVSDLDDAEIDELASDLDETPSAGPQRIA